MLKIIRFLLTVGFGLGLIIGLVGLFCCLCGAQSIFGFYVGADAIYTFFAEFIFFAMTIACGLILYVIIYFWYGNDHKCPSCNKPFCLKNEGLELIDRQNVKVIVENKMRNNNGEIIGTCEQVVDGERNTFKVNYRCKKCGERCYSTYSRDVPKL